ncbi:MAG TPA: flagellin [Hyphomonadaceae bacterium]|jgi:flagellin|nr:flagellin [Hyphomonadaceae bacterium]
MLSVNSNFGASVALQSLNSTNKELNEVQNRISTGLKVASARDNGAVYAIAEGQRARVSSVAAVKDGIDRASSVVDVALAAGKSVGEILQKLKAKAVAAQADDLTSDQRDALQADFTSLRAQIDTIANAAQFNGANLAVGSTSLNVLISDLGGSVAATTDGVQTAALTTPISGSALVIDAGDNTGDLADGDLITFALTDSTNNGTFTIEVELTAGMTVDQFVEAVNSSSGGKISASYDDTAGQFTYLINDTNFDDLAISSDGTDGTNLGDGVATATVSSAGSNTFQVSGFDFSLTGSILSPLASTDISVSTAAATTASNAIDTAITSLNQSLATMGSQAAALDIQNDFLSSLSDVIEQGIGNLVDADLAKESARLQSLQIKQQLGAQALSIANQAPSLILSFFR